MLPINCVASTSSPKPKSTMRKIFDYLRDIFIILSLLGGFFYTVTLVTLFIDKYI